LRNSLFVLSTIGLAYVAFVFLSIPVSAYAGLGSVTLVSQPGTIIGAGIGFGLAALGGGIAVGYAGSAAIAAIAEKPNLFGRAIIIVALGEGIAIYGFVIVFLLTTL
jgi:V/A-type H+/Na+-transporting ATPase subunit K